MSSPTLRSAALPILALAFLLALVAGPVARAQQREPWQPSTTTSYDMRPLFYPVKNQFFRGSCGTFAGLAAMEWVPGIPRLSEAYIYSRIKSDAIAVDGITLESLKEFLESHGVVAAEKMPYELVGVFAFDGPNPSEAAIGRAFNTKRARQAAILEDDAIYHARGIRIYQQADLTWSFMETTLRSGKPIICAFHLNGAQWTNAPRGIIHSDTIRLDDGSTVKLPNDGGHAVLCVGFRTIIDPDDPARERTLRQILIRNSWGPEWGEQGYGWVTWETYARQHCVQAMTIDGVDVVVGPYAMTPVLDLRCQGFKWGPGRYSAFLSIVVKSNWVPEGAIASVEYTLYSGAAKMSPELERFPIETKTSNDVQRGCLATFDNLATSALNVKAFITYREGGHNTFWFPVPEICQWSPEPDTAPIDPPPAGGGGAGTGYFHVPDLGPPIAPRTGQPKP